MLRRRTATLSLTALALVAAAPLITSCGVVHPGSAAVVGNRSISVAELQSQVKQVRVAQNKTGQGDQLIDATSDLDRSTLNSLVFDAVLDRAAHNVGVSVSAGAVQKLEAGAVQQAGGADALRSALLQQYMVAPGQIDQFFHTQAEAQGIADRLGVNLATQQGHDAVTAELTKASQQLHVDVNPRYGKWNSKTLALGASAQPWLRNVSTPVAPQPVQG